MEREEYFIHTAWKTGNRLPSEFTLFLLLVFSQLLNMHPFSIDDRSEISLSQACHDENFHQGTDRKSVV